MESKRIVLITGALRGIGLQISKRLITEGQFNVFLTSRNKEQATPILEELQKLNSSTKIYYHPLSVDQPDSINQLQENIQNNGIKIDVLLNNAGLSDFLIETQDPYLQAIELFGVNLFGIINLCEAIQPLMAEDGKIINVSSDLGRLSLQSEELAKELSQPHTKAQIINKANSLIEARKRGELDGWKYTISKTRGTSNSLYRASKVLLNVYTRFVLSQLPQTAISVHPGWVQTNMGSSMAPLTLEQGIKSIYKAIVEIPFGDKSYTGKFLNEEGDEWEF